MTAAQQRNAVLRDVTLRDGLQLTGKLLSTERKVDIARRLLAMGVSDLEIGSMARGDLVPPMANTADVIAALNAEELDRCWVWVATPRHIEKAAAAGARKFQYCLSASDAHNQANIGRSAEDSVAAFPDAVRLTRDVGGQIQLCIATAFTCPFDGEVPVERVMGIANDPRTDGACDVVLCDTLGQAIPAQVAALFHAAAAHNPHRRLVFHGHDTWGLGVANSLAAIAAGAAMIDGSLGGLGGCPFAPGASGNTSTEDLLFATRPHWFSPEVLKRMVELTDDLLTELNEPNRSKTVQGAHSTAHAFPWVIDSGPR